ncbi:hypothetical protein D3C87_1597660 [compost metagenome]
MQIIEKEFRKAGFVFKDAGDEFVDVQTAIERDTRQRKRQRDGFGTAQGFDFAASTKANQQRSEGL